MPKRIMHDAMPNNQKSKSLHFVKSRRSGFTMLEIMIVTGLIGLLAVISIPSFLKARARSQTNQCISNLRQINSAIDMWALEKRQPTNAPVSWSDISGYIKSEPFCPSGGTTFVDSYTITTAAEAASCLKDTSNHTYP